MTWFKTGILAALCCVMAGAEPITYTEQQTGSGSLGSTSFTNALVTIVLTGDTTAITGGSGFFSDVGTSATVTVSGIGTANFTDPMQVFDNQSTPAAGICDKALGCEDVLDTVNSAFSAYTLAAAIGPLSGNPLGNPFQSFPTTLGAFILTSSDDATNPSTFIATPVPEPESLSLLSLGCALLLVARRYIAA